MIGDVLLDCEWAGETLAGFENHAGRTILDEGAEPLGRVVAGFGNDGALGVRGLPLRPGATARTSTARCCRATPGSPICLLAEALAHATVPASPHELAPLPDELEHRGARGLRRARPRARRQILQRQTRSSGAQSAPRYTAGIARLPARRGSA